LVIGVRGGIGKGVELGDVVISPFEEVDAVIAKWNDHACAFQGAGRGLDAEVMVSA
jgi:hypothetical protein